MSREYVEIWADYQDGIERPDEGPSWLPVRSFREESSSIDTNMVKMRREKKKRKKILLARILHLKREIAKVHDGSVLRIPMKNALSDVEHEYGNLCD